jgi:hypothetical protein
MFKKIFILSICAGIFSSVACIVFDKVYFFAFEIEFKQLVNPLSLAAINIFALVIAGIGYYFIRKWFRRDHEKIFNLLFVLLSFASILAPLSISLPLSIKNPEFFPGLAVPMHFFPAVSWFAVKPFFMKE